MDEKDLKALIEEQNRVWNELRSQLDASRGAVEESIQRMQDRLDEIETELRRPRQPEPKPNDVARKALFGYLRTGAWPKDAPETVVKALQTQDDTAAGYLTMPPEVETEIIKTITETSPMRQVARVRPIGADSLILPKRTGTFSAAWVAEQGSRTETTGLTYGQERVPVHECYALVDVSQQMLEDSRYDLEAELRSEFSEQISVLENTAFVTGDGVGKPEGFTQTSSNSVETVNSGSSGDFDGDDLITLLTTLKERYWQNATWAFTRVTLRKIRQLKDSSGQYVWAPGLAGSGANNLARGFEPTILDRPYVLFADMADTGSANALSVAIGDWQRAYVIVDRIGMMVQRDPYTQATSGNIRFIARKRTGGQVVLPEAIKILKEAV